MPGQTNSDCLYPAIGIDNTPALCLDTRVVFPGMDLNLDGALDLFAGVNNQSSHDQLGIGLPGLGVNNSPATTSIGTLVNNYSESSLDYSFIPVSAAMHSAAPPNSS